jgi:hypothetical protein
VPYELSGQRVVLVVDPHSGQVHGVFHSVAIRSSPDCLERQRKINELRAPPAPGLRQTVVIFDHRNLF